MKFAVRVSSEAWRRGVIAGALGASAVAVWFLIVDLAEERPFYTPRALGAALLSVLGTRVESPAVDVIAYAMVHYVLFVIAGLIVTGIVHAADREPTMLAGAFILFIALELAFYVFASMLAHTVLRELAWYSVAVANIFASVAMGWYLWRHHPGLGRDLAYSSSGEERPRG